MDSSERPSFHSSALKIAGAYAIFGVLWILYSDRLVQNLVSSGDQLTTLQTLKGWAFVLVSAAFIHGLVVREHRRLIETNTELETALQQAYILHRILRHNLRNICTIFGGAIDRLDRSTTAAPPDAVTLLRTQNERLINLSNKSRHLRDFLLMDSVELREYDLESLVESAVDDARERYDAATINVETPPAVTVYAHHLIEGAIEELLENAIEHNHTDTPTVWVTVTAGAQWTTLTIEDDGPGIPNNERSALRAQYETELEHSQGLGLWLVQLTVENSGGELVLGESEHGGAAVAVRLPVVASRQ